LLPSFGGIVVSFIEGSSILPRFLHRGFFGSKLLRRSKQALKIAVVVSFF
jgi:hypothetical protein